ncbi:hypothetical protein C8Q77DRAFT_1161891 [Trametes polyzona]|nr:hypothetical protein C8Q77DRAFT_1161891 [Trametes polyzona]
MSTTRAHANPPLRMQAGSQSASALLGLLGIVVQDVNVLVGLNCSPISVIGVGTGDACSGTAVCCEDNSHLGTLPRSSTWCKFTQEDAKYLAMYIAKYNPKKEGRLGNKLYETLCENPNNKWSFAKRHPWQSWRNYYKNNEDKMDRLINKYIGQQSSSAPTPPAPSRPSVAPSAPHKDRSPFTQEDDDNLAEYIVDHWMPSGMLGQRYWQDLYAKEEDMPWLRRHTWQSWRERYKNNQQYFDQVVRRRRLGEEFDEPLVPRPRTADDWRVKNRYASEHKGASSSQKASQGAGPSIARTERALHDPLPDSKKRSRASEKTVTERPAKKQRVVEEQKTVDGRVASVSLQDADNPAQDHKEGVPDEAQTGSGVVTDGQGAGVGQDEGSVAQNGADAKEASGKVEQDSHANGSNDSDSTDDESEDKENRCPPGSDDYTNEIFDPTEAASALDKEDGPGENDVDSSDESQEDERSKDVPSRPDQPGATVVTDHRDGATLAETQPEATGSTLVDEDMDKPTGPTHQGTTSLEQRDPPPRKHAHRIRDMEAPILTPELSPTQEAAVRHHGDQPVPRKRKRRIRKVQDEEFFGTPSPLSSADEEVEGVDLDSPTTEAEARHHAHPHVKKPPRLEEGAFNKAFSDPLGRSRLSSSGKARRRSVIEQEDMEDAQSAEPEHDGEDPNEEHASVLPQWSPERQKDSEQDKERHHPPATPKTVSPSNVKDKEREQTVMTKIVSVRTVRTVEHDVDGRSEDDSLSVRAEEVSVEVDMNEVEGDQEPLVEGNASLSDVEMVDEGDGGDPGFMASQHHPFSQAHHPFSQRRSPSTIPRSAPRTKLPVAQADLARFRRLLGLQPSPARPKQSMTILPEADRRRLASLLQKDGEDSLPEQSKLTDASSSLAASVSTASDSPNPFGSGSRNSTLKRAQPSPLAKKGDSWSSVAERRGHIVPQHPPHHDDEEHPTPRIDKGKGRADPIPANAHPRRYTVNGEAAHDVFQEPRASSLSASGRPRRIRQSLPARFDIGDDSFFSNRTALSLALRPFSSGHLHPSTIPSTTSLSRSVSPAKSPNTSLADTLPEHELEMVKELGMNTAIHIMARNHGFGEAVVREVYLSTGSLELTDNVLREMREGANDRASEVLSSLAADEEQDTFDDDVDEGAVGEEAEIERELTQPPEVWGAEELRFDLAAEPPLAESSRVETSVSAASGSRGRRKTFFIEPLMEDSPAQGYSPPKHTRAARHLKQNAKA